MIVTLATSVAQRVWDMGVWGGMTPREYHRTDLSIAERWALADRTVARHAPRR